VARVFITGSSDGLGLMAARLLIDQGHEVVLHGRNEGRSRDALAAAAGAGGVVSGDLSTIAGARTVADEVNKLGRFDAVIHNAGIGYREGRVEMEPGVPSVFAVNVLAPYILTALIERPQRLVYLSSGMHRGVRPQMDDLLWTKRPWSGSSAYAESKLCDVLLAFAVARRWKDVASNALEPGWVATKMGGSSAPDDLHQGCVTQAWLATSKDEFARSSGGYFYHQRPRAPNPIAADLRTQEGVADRVRPHFRHTSRLTVRPDGAQPGQLVLTFRSYQEPRNRKFESSSLHRRVCCEPDFRGRSHRDDRRGFHPARRC
jgi:NAD(P)-dependent dehydrogenase (short-subunit alcohol dehydrogenase family)